MHERSVEHDLLLLALRRILSRQEQKQEQRQGQRPSRAARRPRRRGASRVQQGDAPTATATMTATMTATATVTATATATPPPPPRLRVGLMSATADAAMLGSYFAASLRAPVARVAVDGRSYPVETLHLEDALAATRHVVRPAAAWCIHSEVARRRFAEEGLLPPPLERRAALRERFPHARDEVLDANPNSNPNPNPNPNPSPN